MVLLNSNVRKDGKNKHQNINQKVLCRIKERKMLFFDQKKKQLFDKIAQRMNAEYMKLEPDPVYLIKLRKKYQMLDNQYDGTISFDRQDYAYNAFAKWSFVKDNSESGDQMQLTFLVQVPDLNISLVFCCLESATSQSAVDLLHALNYNLSQGQNWIQRALDMPLTLRNNTLREKRRNLDQVQDVQNFQTVFRFDIERPIWQQKQKITVAQFEAQVQTGDIILFSSNSFGNQMSKLFLGSEYDHVGVMLKYSRSGHIQIFESLRHNGVNKWNWSSFLQKKQHQDYSKIAFRKLSLFNRTAQFQDRESFDKVVFKFVV